MSSALINVSRGCGKPSQNYKSRLVVLLSACFVASMWGLWLVDQKSALRDVGRWWENVDSEMNASIVAQSGAIAPKDDYSPFRHITREIAARSWQKLLGPRPALGAAVCELMVLANPSCEAFLTGERISHHPDGAMMECLEETGGPAAWESVLQVQCLTSTFWGELKNWTSARKTAARTKAKHAPSLDPVVQMHVGNIDNNPLSSAVRPTEYCDALTCYPPPPDEDEIALAMQVNVSVSLLNASFSLGDIDDEGAAQDEALRFARPHHSVFGPLVVRPISLAYPREALVSKPYRYKLWDWMPILPSYYPKYQNKADVKKKRLRSPDYVASSQDEWIVVIMHRLSYFAWTHARGGPDCMRHYDILSSGTVPYFFTLQLLPHFSLSHLPKDLLSQALVLPGVSHLNTVKQIIPNEDLPFYHRLAIPRPWHITKFKQDRLEYLQRKMRQKSLLDEEERLFSQLSQEGLDVDELARVRKLLADDEVEAEMYDEPTKALRHVGIPFRALDSTHYYRWKDSPVLNIKAVGSIDHSVFDKEAYFDLADRLHDYTRKFLSCGSVAKSFLRRVFPNQALGAHRILLMMPSQIDHLAFVLLKGFEEIGVDATVAVFPTFRKHGTYGEGVGKNSKSLIDNGIFRVIPPSGAPWLNSSNPMEAYHRWVKAGNLDEMYGKNYMIGRRVPVTSEERKGVHQQVSVSAACNSILKNRHDLIILAQIPYYIHFPVYPCAFAIRQRDASKVTVAAIDGNDELPVDPVRTFAEEGFIVFSREPNCW